MKFWGFKIHITYMLIITIALSFIYLPAYAEDISYQGTSYGADIIKNASYTDIKGWSNAEEIIRLSALSIIRSYGGGRYYPKSAIKRQDALAAIVRAAGKQDEAIKQVEKIKKSDNNYTTQESYIKGYMETAKSIGLLLQEEYDQASKLTLSEEKQVEAQVTAEAKKNWKMTQAEREKLLAKWQTEKSYNKYYGGYATREEIAVWSARALKLEPAKAQKTMSIYKYKDWRTINTLNLQLIEAAIKKEIISGANRENFLPRGRVSRHEFARILSQTEKISCESGLLGYKKYTGRVSDIKNIEYTDQSGKKKTTEITIQRSSTDSVKLVIEEGITIPVIRSGKIGTAPLIEKNDIVEYTIGEDNRILLFQWRGIKKFVGKFIEYDADTKTAYFNDEKGNDYSLKIEKDTTITARKTPVDIKKLYEGIGAEVYYIGKTLKAMDSDISPEAINTKP